MQPSTLLQINSSTSEILRYKMYKILDGICLEKTYLDYQKNLKENFPDAEDAFLKELTLGIKNTLGYCYELNAGVWNWKIMERDDRMSVINTFYQVFNQPLQTFTAKQRTIIFCKVFLNEFAPFLLGSERLVAD